MLLWQTKLRRNMWLVCRFAAFDPSLDGGFTVSTDQNAYEVENGLPKKVEIGGKMLAEVLCGRLNAR